MELFHIPYQDFKAFFLIWTRVGMVLFLFPFFSSRTIPTLSKIGLALLFTIILFPVTNLQSAPDLTSTGGLVKLIASELLIGVILGLLIQIFFEGVKMMGEVVGFQIGLSISNILDPQSGIQVSVLSNMAYLLSIVLFLIFDGHHVLLRGLKQSFEIIRIGSIHLTEEGFLAIARKCGDLFVLAVKIGAPAIASLLLMKMAFGFIARVMPQLNIMIDAFPVQVVVGLLFFGASLVVLERLMAKYTGGLDILLIKAMMYLKG